MFRSSASWVMLALAACGPAEVSCEITEISGADAALDVVFAGELWSEGSNLTDLEVEWSSSEDGTVGNTAISDDGTLNRLTGALSVGVHDISLAVLHKRQGVVCSDTQQHDIGTPPSVSLVAPDEASVVKRHERVMFEAVIADDEESPDTLTISWTSALDGLLGSSTADESGRAVFETTALSLGLHTVEATVVDALELSSTASQTIEVVPNSPPEIDTVEVTPEDVYTDTEALTCVWQGFFDANGDADQSEIQWTVDGSPVSTNAVLKGSHTSEGRFVRGRSYACTVTPFDGDDSGTPVTTAVTGQNSVPAVSAVDILPKAPVVGDVLSCSYAFSDLDLEDTDQSKVEWRVNGDPWFDGDLLSEIRGGEAVECRVTPMDGQDAGVALTASIVIENTPPMCSFLELLDDLYADEDVVPLEAEVFDPDEALDELLVTWQSDLDGALGSGVVSPTGDSLLEAGPLSAGLHVISLVVTDSTGAECLATRVVEVEKRPVIQSISPAEISSFIDGEVITLSVGATDDPAPASELHYSWRSSLDGVLFEGGGDPDGTLVLNVDLSVGEHLLTVTVTDAVGLEATESILLQLAPNQPPSIDSVEIIASPGPVMQWSTLSPQTSGWQDAEGASPAYIYRWSTDGATLSTEPTLDWEVFEAGQVIDLRVTPTDGVKNGASAYASVTIEDYCSPSEWSNIGSLCQSMNGSAFIEMGTAFAFGDVDDDDVDDLVMTTGEATLVYSGSSIANFVDGETYAPDLVLPGVPEGNAAGVSFAMGDIDGDGKNDFVVGAPHQTVDEELDVGVVYIYLSRYASGWTSATSSYFGEEAGALFGSTLGIGDLDGDGYSELFVGSPASGNETGAIFIFDGYELELRKTREGLASDAAHILFGEVPGSRIGDSFSVGDVDGDGRSALLVVAPLAPGGGRAYLVDVGTMLSQQDLLVPTDADIEIWHPQMEQLGENILLIPDMDGDGARELLVVAGDTERNALLVLSETLTTSGSVLDLSASADTVFYSGEYSGDTLEVSAPGDLDGDHLAELVFSVPLADDPLRRLSETGRSSVFFASDLVPGSVDVDLLDAQIFGEEEGQRAGARGSSVFEIDGDFDGLGDLVVLTGGIAEEPGRLYLLPSPGDAPPSEPAPTIEGLTSENDLKCTLMGPVVDADGDEILEYHLAFFVDGVFSGFEVVSSEPDLLLTVPASETAVGEEWSCRATASNALNSAPVIVTSTISLMSTCNQLLQGSGPLASGVYELQRSDGTGTYSAYCDMETDGGGWTAIINPNDLSMDYLYGLPVQKMLDAECEATVVVEPPAFDTSLPDALVWGTADAWPETVQLAEEHPLCTVEVEISYSTVRLSLSATHLGGMGWLNIWDYPYDTLTDGERSAPTIWNTRVAAFENSQGCAHSLYLTGNMVYGQCAFGSDIVESNTTYVVPGGSRDMIAIQQSRKPGQTYQPRYVHEVWVR